MFVNLSSDEKQKEKLSKELKNMSYVCDKYKSEQFSVYGTFTNDV